MDKNARILEIGIELGAWRSVMFNADADGLLTGGTMDYLVFSKMCLLFMEYEELTRGDTCSPSCECAPCCFSTTRNVLYPGCIRKCMRFAPTVTTNV